MIFYNTTDKRLIELAFKELASYGIYIFLASVVIKLYTEVELEEDEKFQIFNIVFNKFDITKYEDMISKTEIYKL